MYGGLARILLLTKNSLLSFTVFETHNQSVKSPCTGADMPTRILVVEDEPYLQEYLSVVLTDYGYQVSLCADGVEALNELLMQHIPDLLLTDIKMPRMSGMQLIEICHQSFPRLPMVVCSGYLEPWQIEKLQSRGVGFIQKPFYEKDLVNVIENSLRNIWNSWGAQQE